MGEKIGTGANDRTDDLGVGFARQQPCAHAAQVLGRIDQPQVGEAFRIPDRAVGARAALHADAFGTRGIEADAVVRTPGEHADAGHAGRMRDRKLHRHVGAGGQAGDRDAVAVRVQRGQPLDGRRGYHRHGRHRHHGRTATDTA